jgi:ElaA protein
MNWITKSFDELSITELYDMLQLRAEVFVVEQTCPYQDLDGKDQKAIHLWCTNKGGIIGAYCRVLPAGVSYEEPSIGRVVTAPDARGMGFGRQLMLNAIEYIKTNWPEQSIRISAQCYLEKFYTSLGFEKVSEPYMEDDIPHIEMLMSA